MSPYNDPPPPPVSKRYERPSEDITLGIVRDIRRCVRQMAEDVMDLCEVMEIRARSRRLTSSELRAIERGFYQVEAVKPRAMWAAGEALLAGGIVPAGRKSPGPVIPHG